MRVNTNTGMISAAASIGMLMQWNVESGVQAIDKYMSAEDPHIKVQSIFSEIPG